MGGLSKTADTTGDSSKMLTLGKEGMGGIGPGEKYYESWNNTFAERSDFLGGLKNMFKNAKRQYFGETL